MKMGVVGSVSLLQNMTIASQPISSIDWSPDKVQEGVVVTLSKFIVSMFLILQEGLLACCSFDQTVRVCIVTKLNRV